MSIVDEIIHSEIFYSGRPADSFQSIYFGYCEGGMLSKTGQCYRLSLTQIVEYNFIILLHEQTLEKTDGSIKNV